MTYFEQSLGAALDAKPAPWMVDAACSAVDPELFFAPPSEKGKTTRAKDICRECPVLADCLGFALEGPEQHGIWGGTTVKQRRDIKRAGVMAEQAKRQAIENLLDRTYARPARAES